MKGFFRLAVPYSAPGRKEASDAVREVSYDKKIFAGNLIRLMRENHDRQVDLARLLGVSKTTLSAYCKGEQMPRMDKLEQLALHFGVSRSALIEENGAEASMERLRAAPRPSAGDEAKELYLALNDRGRSEFMRYGRFLSAQAEYRSESASGAEISYIKRYIVPAAAGYASPIEGEDYELIPRAADAPLAADFCLNVSGDSMEPFIHDGELIYVQRDAPLHEFDAGVFFVDGDVFCKQWCVDYAGTLHLLSANPLRQDANITIRRDAPRSCVCFGKVLLPHRLPQPSYY